jgi:hypothetical protein
VFGIPQSEYDDGLRRISSREYALWGLQCACFSLEVAKRSSSAWCALGTDSRPRAKSLAWQVPRRVGVQQEVESYKHSMQYIHNDRCGTVLGGYKV